MNTLGKTLERLVYAVNELKQDIDKDSCPNVETNTAVPKPNNSIGIDETIPIEELIVLEGSLNGNRVKVLKDDGFNRNVISHESFAKIGKNINSPKCLVEVLHSKKDSAEYHQKPF